MTTGPVRSGRLFNDSLLQERSPCLTTRIEKRGWRNEEPSILGSEISVVSQLRDARSALRCGDRATVITRVIKGGQDWVSCDPTATNRRKKNRPETRRFGLFSCVPSACKTSIPGSNPPFDKLTAA